MEEISLKKDEKQIKNYFHGHNLIAKHMFAT